MSGSCPRADEVDAALDRRLSDDAARDALVHADRCPDCDALRRARPRVRELLDALPDGAPDELSARRLRARLVSSALRRGALPRPRWGFVAVAVAAALALVVGVRVARAPAVEPLGPGESRLGVAGALRPSPGAVWSLRDERGDTRVLLDDGVVTLRVQKRRAGERFRVVLRDAEVEVRGTRFEVTAHGGSLRAVRVEEGLVAVRRRGDAELLLAAGSRFVAPAEAPPPELRRDPPAAPSTVVAEVTPRRPVLSGPDPGREFRAGALAHVRGDHATAAAALGRFLTSSSPSDPRREDARYVRVLALRGAGREEEAAAEAWRYLREFPAGLRCAETASWLARARAARGDCEGAARAAMRVPEGASAATRSAVARALAACGR
jgi:TolA-binding protein